MEKHTQWSIKPESPRHSYTGIDTGEGDGYSSIELYGPARHKRARRIVACVNACEGMPTETLETAAIGPNVAEWFRDWSALPAEAHELGVKEWIEAQKAQRAALVEVVDELLRYFQSGNDTPVERATIQTNSELIKKARALRAGERTTFKKLNEK